MNQGIVLGIDGGGTYTRIVASDLFGTVLASAKKEGSHPGKNKNPEKNVKDAIFEVLQKANHLPNSVRCIVGGFAGLNNPADKLWVGNFLNVPGISCPKILLNDAEIAQYGAFIGKHGVLAVAGTGSIVFAKTEDGNSIKNYDFHHDSVAGSRYLSYSVIYEIITQRTSYKDQQLIDQVIDYWGVDTIEELRLLAAKGFTADKVDAIKRLSSMGAIVTKEALNGSETARRACKQAVKSLVTGVLLVSSTFTSDFVPLALGGGVIKTPYMEDLFKKELHISNSNKNYTYHPIQLSPVMGGVLYALNEIGLPINDGLVESFTKADKKHQLYDS
ncbi:BadF/BadG/BcrA/BcrD ATPase family protein [Neobacillus niacini]|uniref:BadF/BadG/BcrA/BcrD ATPase family protein n=1 Tax=Neobacillus niacini TaxID=86668 RepID=UPI0039833F6D